MYKTFKKVSRDMIELAQPLPFTIYSRSGMALIKMDDTITSEEQFELIVSTGYFYEYAQPEQSQQASIGSVFEFVDHLKSNLLRMYGQFQDGDSRDIWVERLRSIAKQLQQAVTRDRDATLASLALEAETSYLVLHQIYVAVVCEIMAKKQHVPDDVRLTMLCAALSHDIGLLDIQDDLEYSQDELSDDLRDAIMQHPESAEASLRELGVADELWLRLVRSHQERLDGSGYPDRLAGEQLDPLLRIFILSDTFSALVRDRPYRKAMLPRFALSHMLTEQGGKIDPELTRLLTKEIGLFPTGTIVTLNNGETGVVSKPRGKKPFPVVMVFADQNGMPRDSLVSRDTSEEKYSIAGMEHFSTYKKWRGMLKRIWS